MSEARCGVGLIGCGTVGGGVVQLLREHAASYACRCGSRVELRRVLVRDVDKAMREHGLDAAMVTSEADAFFKTPGLDIVVEVAGGTGVTVDYVRRALEAGKHVVTANKAMLASRGRELFALARQRGVSVAFEGSCGGGIPCVTGLQFGLMANEVRGLFGILNGTCNYILTEMTQKGRSYAEALADAKRKGYAEADETLDVSGADAAQKLSVLASLAFGASVGGSDVACEGIDRLELADIRFGAELGYDIKLIASAERVSGGGLLLSTRPCFLSVKEQLAQVHGSFNALSIVGDAVGHVMMYGRGAGRGPTASAVVSDVLNVASGWYPLAFAQMRLTPDCHEPAVLVDAMDSVSRFYLRFNAKDVPGVFGTITSELGGSGISLSAVMQHDAEDAASAFVPVVITTHPAREGAVREACRRVSLMDVVDGSPVVLRVLEVDV